MLYGRPMCALRAMTDWPILAKESAPLTMTLGINSKLVGINLRGVDCQICNFWRESYVSGNPKVQNPVNVSTQLYSPPRMWEEGLFILYK